MALVDGADVSFGNFETTIIDRDRFVGTPQAESGGSWLFSDPDVAADLKHFGFDLLSHANNHAMDWGAEALLATAEHLRRAGLTVAGSGETLSAARQPRYCDSANGRIGLVCASSSFPRSARAADPVGRVPGRPGINPYRAMRMVVLSPENLAVLARIRNSQRRPEDRADYENGLSFLGNEYLPSDAVGDGVAFTFRTNEQDKQAILAALRQARQNSDFVVFSLHNHQPGFSNRQPPAFLTDISRQAVEAGADAVVVHGSHEVGPIEIHRGRPIFYSLGDFVFEGHMMSEFPADLYETFGLPLDTPPDAISRKHDETYFRNPDDYKSILALSRFGRDGVDEIDIHPIDLNVDGQATAKGLPRLAHGALAREILESLKALSEPFGTTVTVSGDTARISIR